MTLRVTYTMKDGSEVVHEVSDPLQLFKLGLTQDWRQVRRGQIEVLFKPPEPKPPEPEEPEEEPDEDESVQRETNVVTRQRWGAMDHEAKLAYLFERLHDDAEFWTAMADRDPLVLEQMFTVSRRGLILTMRPRG